MATTASAAPGLVSAGSCADYATKQTCLDTSSESLHCVWANAVPGDPDAGNYKCQAFTCSSVSDMEAGGGGMDVECKALGCKWWEDVYVCTESNETPACELYYADPQEGTKCPSQCVYNTDVEKCMTKGATPACDYYFEEDTCNANPKCAFTASIYKCWDKGSTVPCIEFQYYSQEECPDYCKWVPTNDATYGESGTCVDENAMVACEDYSFSEDGSTCPPERCEYHTNEALCWAKDKDIPCYKLKGETCAPLGRCDWYSAGSYGGGSCGDCASGDNGCVQKWTPPAGNNNDEYENDAYGSTYGHSSDNGNKCSTFVGDELYSCPEPRCYLDWEQGSGHSNANTCEGGGEDGTSTCRDSVCSDLGDEQDACKAKTGCAYDADTGVCSTPGEAFPCKEVYNSEACAAHSDDCSWKGMMDGDDDEGFCYNTGDTIPCTRYDEGEKFCPTATCKWMAGTYTCVDKDYQPQCNEYGREGDCPASDGCTWTNGVCWEEGKDIPCAAFCTAFECTASGKCQFDKNMYTCNDCEGGSCPKLGECSSYTTDLTCPEAKCEFAYDDVDSYSQATPSGTCQDKVCVGIYNKDECNGQAAGCDWHAGAEAGVDNGSCFKKGFNVPCNKIWDKDDCAANSCTWDADEYSCLEKGVTSGCHMIDEDDCKSGTVNADCEWNDNRYQCMVKSSVEPATPPPLNGKGDGTGNEDESKCTPQKFDEVKSKLEQAEDECVVVGRRNRNARDADEQQLECLAYFLAQSPNPTNAKDACPCLWFFAKEVSPWNDHWMQIPC